MSDCNIRIKRLVNGYTVCMTDPKIVEQNRKRDNSKGPSIWKDPEVTMAFKTEEEVIKFLKANLSKVLPTDEYETSFAEALGEEDDD